MAMENANQVGLRLLIDSITRLIVLFKKVLRDVFGHSSFRLSQEAVGLYLITYAHEHVLRDDANRLSSGC